MKTILPLLLVGQAVSAALDLTSDLDTNPHICQPIAARAGDQVSAIIGNPLNSRCEATVKALDDSFGPVTFKFERARCLGLQVAQLDVPREAPNGEVFIFWSCGGRTAQSCTLVNVTGGSSRADMVLSPQLGKIGCLQQVSSILTTLRTITSGITTWTEPRTTLVQMFSTSFSARSTAASGKEIGASLPGAPTNTPTSASTSTPTIGAFTPITAPPAPPVTSAATPMKSGTATALTAVVSISTVWMTMTAPCRTVAPL